MKKAGWNYKEKLENLKKIFDIHPFWSNLKYYFLGIINKVDNDHAWVMSSGIAFNIIICAIPFTLILLSIASLYLGSANAGDTIEKYLNNIIGITPALKEKIKNATMDKIYEMTDLMTITGIIGIVGLLWTASGLFGTIRVVLNRIYKAREDYPYFKGKILDIGMVILVIITFLLSYSSSVIFTIIEKINERFLGETLPFITDTLGFIVPIAIGFFFSFLMFYMLFRLVPHGKIDKNIVRISTVTAAVMYESLKLFFLLYVTNFTNLSKVYGTYAAIVAVILWIYYSSFVFVIGAEFGQLYYERKIKK